MARPSRLGSLHSQTTHEGERPEERPVVPPSARTNDGLWGPAAPAASGTARRTPRPNLPSVSHRQTSSTRGIRRAARSLSPRGHEPGVERAGCQKRGAEFTSAAE